MWDGGVQLVLESLKTRTTSISQLGKQIEVGAHFPSQLALSTHTEYHSFIILCTLVGCFMAGCLFRNGTTTVSIKKEFSVCKSLQSN